MKNGTRYRNQNTSGQWNTYLLRDLTETGFTMDQEGSAYHVRYTLTPVGNGETKLTYTEWVDEGDIAEPFTSDILDVLKACVENA